MVRSMTAFASQAGEAEGINLSWELRSVNHRYLDLNVKLPETFRFLEARVREQVAARLKRGKVECVLNYRMSLDRCDCFDVNLDRARQLLLASADVGRLIDHPANFSALDVLRWPGVLEDQKMDMHAFEEVALLGLEQALSELLGHREREGKKLAEAIHQRCLQVDALVADCRQQLPQVRSAVQQKILKRLAEVKVEPDNQRFEQELVYLLHKLDIDEELDRLTVHLDEIKKALVASGPIGRRLDFLMQELNREANTIGSKATEVGVTAVSVDIKVLIEQMREQIQNIE